MVSGCSSSSETSALLGDTPMTTPSRSVRASPMPGIAKHSPANKGGRKAANPLLSDDERRKERVLKNRESAMKSLLKKKRYTEDLEAKAAGLHKRNEELKLSIRRLLARLSVDTAAIAGGAEQAQTQIQPQDGTTPQWDPRVPQSAQPVQQNPQLQHGILDFSLLASPPVLDLENQNQQQQQQQQQCPLDVQYQQVLQPFIQRQPVQHPSFQQSQNYDHAQAQLVSLQPPHNDAPSLLASNPSLSSPQRLDIDLFGPLGDDPPTDDEDGNDDGDNEDGNAADDYDAASIMLCQLQPQINDAQALPPSQLHF
jgi:Basic region leucine zipper